MTADFEQEPPKNSGRDGEKRPPRAHLNAEDARRLAEEARKKGEMIFTRAYGLVRDPKTEWEQIRAEETATVNLLLGYVAPLATIPPLAGLIGSLIFGVQVGSEVVRTPIGTALLTAIVTIIASVALVYFLGLLINAIADNFDGERDELSAQKVAAYSMTPAFLSGVFSLWPPLWWVGLVGIAMSAFLFYRGLPPLMRCPEERALGYATTSILAGLVAFIVLFGVLTSCVIGVGRL
ncbi:MAG: Yip1 family protein [Caulobacterales bacterium]